MAVIVRIVIDPASQEDHDRLASAVEARIEHQGGPPDGLMVHLGTPVGNGFVITEAWRNEELFRGYQEHLLKPALTEAGLLSGEAEISAAWSIALP